MSIPRRLGRLARGLTSNLNDERLKETVRVGRERSETLKDAFEAAWRGATEEWRAARVSAEERACGTRTYGWRYSSPRYTPKKFPLDVITAYHRLGLGAGSPLGEVRKRRRELVKRHHPDRFVDPEHRERAEKQTAEINAAHDTVERYLVRS